MVWCPKCHRYIKGKKAKAKHFKKYNCTGLYELEIKRLGLDKTMFINESGMVQYKQKGVF